MSRPRIPFRPVVLTDGLARAGASGFTPVLIRSGLDLPGGKAQPR